MFRLNEVLTALKLQVSHSSSSEFTHCQLLNLKAQELGFQSYYHLRESLKRLPIEQLSRVSTNLMRQICQTKLPSLKNPYYEFLVLEDNAIGFYSQWIGWDKYGNEVRAPRPLNAQASVPALRDQSTYPIYVVESPRELLSWQYGWKSTAYIPEALAKKFFASSFTKKKLVAKNPPIELIRQKAKDKLASLI